MMSFRTCLATIGLSACLLSAGLATPASAALSCTVGAISGGYGVVDILSGSADDSTASFAVTCAGGSASSIIRLCVEIGLGATAAGPSSERVLRSSADYLDHEFYADSGRTQLWGSWGAVVTSYGTAGVQQDLTLNGSGNGTANFTAYSRVAAGQSTRQPGSYSWTGSSPALKYGVKTATACPTGGSSASSSGTNYTATINANCNVSATDMSFGSKGNLSTVTDATATLTVRCTNGTPYTIGLGAGGGPGATVAARKMTNFSHTTTYSIYSDAARSTVWGNTIGTNTVAGTGTGNSSVLTTYGRVPIQPSPAPGAYGDSVVITVTY